MAYGPSAPSERIDGVGGGVDEGPGTVNGGKSADGN